MRSHCQKTGCWPLSESALLDGVYLLRSQKAVTAVSTPVSADACMDFCDGQCWERDCLILAWFDVKYGTF